MDARVFQLRGNKYYYPSVGAAYQPDALPEDFRWVDRGCRYSPRCTDCPLPKCVLEEDFRSQEATMKTAAVKSLRDMGKIPAEISSLLGVSKRTVYRMLSL